MAKQNDWIVANLNNPDFSSQDFTEVAGMNIDNTQLLDKDFYRNNKYIQSQFTNQEGNFNEDAFNQFYNQAVSKFKEFQEEELLDSFEYSLFDTRANANSKIRDPHFRFETVFNPDRRTTGIAGWNQLGERQWTPSELAQTQKIWDPNTNSFLDETPNDFALVNGPINYIKNLFTDPLVLATYDEDGEHFDPMTGQMVKHKKGQYKMNEEGTYYSEKLNGRSPIGKQVISSMDLLTIDGEGVNKYDFFDSDSLDKSATGTIMKNLVTVAPLLYSPIAGIYSAVLIGREMTKSLPMLYGMASSLFASDAEDLSGLNTLAAYAQKYTGGVSEYGQQHMFSFENLGNLIGDVALQWGQQKTIARAYNKLRGGSQRAFAKADAQAKSLFDEQYIKAQQAVQQGKMKPEDFIRYFHSADNNWKTSTAGITAMQKFLPQAEKIAKRNARMGADLALAYMALVSNYDVYNDLIAQGLTKREASLVSLMSTAGMFSVDKFLNLGDMFFDDLEDQYLTAARRFLKEEAEGWRGSFIPNAGKQAIEEQELGIPSNFFQKVVRSGRKVANRIADAASQAREDLKYHTLSAVGKAVGEGLEETSEEFVTDMSKQLYEWAGALGANTTKRDIGAWEDMSDRYLMSFLGGTLGGGLFYTVDQLKMAIENKDNPVAKQGERELVYLIRQGRKNDVLKQLDELHRKGKLGSTKLSHEHIYDEEKKTRTFLTTSEEHTSQNDFIYKALVDQVNQIDNVLNTYGVNLSDDELFEQMVLGNDRLLRLRQPLDGVMFMTGYRQKYQQLVQDLVAIETEIQAKENTKTDGEKREEQQQQGQATETTDQLKAKRQEILDKLNGYKDGTQSFYYTRMMLTMADPQIGQAFMFYTFEDWCNRVKKQDPTNLSPAEIKTLKEEYNEAKTKQELTLEEKFNAYLEFEKKFEPLLASIDSNKARELNGQVSDYTALRKDLKINIGWDDKLDSESEEDFENRNHIKPGETEEQFVERLNNRREAIIKENTLASTELDEVKEQLQKIIDYIATLPNGSVDPITYRLLKQKLSIDKYVAWQTALRDSLLTDTGDLQSSFSDFIQDVIHKHYEFIVDSQIQMATNNKKALQENAQSVGELINEFSKGNSANISRILDIINGELEQELGIVIHTIDIDNGDYVDKEQIQNWINNELNDVINDLVEEEARLNQQAAIRDEAINALQTVRTYTQANTAVIMNTLQADIASQPKEEVKDYLDDVLRYLAEFVTNFKVDNILEAKNEESLNVAIDELASKLTNVSHNDLQIKNNFKKEITDFIYGLVNKHPLVNFYITTESKLGELNPVLQLINQLSEYFNLSRDTIENVVNKIQQRIESNAQDEFILTNEEIQSLQYIETIINLAKSYITSASSIPNWISPDGHNKFINDFSKKVPDLTGYTELPELDSDLGMAYGQELDNYLNTIARYKQLHEQNNANRNLLLAQAQQAHEEARRQFFKHNIEAFKKSLNGEVDLLDDDDLSKPITEIERKLAVNLFNYLQQNNKSVYDFLKSSNIIQKCIGEDLSDLKLQLTTPVDLNFKYENLHQLDKVRILIDALINNSLKFEEQARSYLNSEPDIIAISAQNSQVRSGKGFLSNDRVIDDFTKYVGEIVKAPINLNRCFIITGNAGVGKTSVVTRRMVQQVKDDELLITAATSKQAQILHGSIGRGKVIGSSSIPDPIKKLMVDYVLDSSSIVAYEKVQTILSDKNLENDKDYGDFKVQGASLIDQKTIKVRKSSGGIKVLVIDEATHVDQVTLQIINRWADQNGVRIILSGDQQQAGNKNGSIEQDAVFCLFRQSPLSISLRETNGYTMLNNQQLSRLTAQAQLNTLLDRQSADDKNKPLIGTIKLNYFQTDNDLQGTKIGSELPQDIIDILKNKSSIAFVGKASSSILKALNKAGVSISNEDIYEDVKAIQGSEYDYVVCDIDWKTLYQLPPKKKGQQYVEFLQNLYTVNSRAKNGVVLMDNGLLDLIGGNVAGETEITLPSLAESAKKFKELEEQRYKNIDFNESIDRHDLTDLVLAKEEQEQAQEEPKKKKQKEEQQEEQQEGEQQEEQQEGGVEEEEQAGEQETTGETPKEEEVHEETLEGETPEEETPEEEQTFDRIEESDYEEPIVNTDYDSFISRGYFMPILGTSFIRDDKGTKVDKIERNFRKDLAIVYRQREVTMDPSNPEYLSNASIANLVQKYQTFIRTLLLGENEELLSQYGLTLDHIKDVFEGKAGDDEGIFIQYNKDNLNDAFIGFTDLHSMPDTFRYILKIRSSAGTTYHITLGFMGTPETWGKQSKRYQNEINKLLKDKPEGYEDAVAEYTAKKSLTDQGIQQLTVFMDSIRANPDSEIKVKLNRCFTVFRPILDKYEKEIKMRFGSLSIPTRVGGNITEMGWLADDGKYKYTSVTSNGGFFILGKDLERDLGINASSSGKVAVLVSEFPYKPEDMFDLYKQQKQSGKEGDLKIRLLVLDNVGISFSTIFRSNWKQLYARKMKLNGEDMEVDIPFSRDAFGYRMLGTLWNWRAYLNQFTHKVQDYLTKYAWDKDKLELVAYVEGLRYYYLKANSRGDFADWLSSASEDDIKLYSKHEKYFDTKFKLSDIKSVTPEDLDILSSMNAELTQNNQHTFRIGYGNYIRQIELTDAQKVAYYGSASKIPSTNPEVNLLFLSLDKAELYLKYINAIFQIFSSAESKKGLGVNLSSLEIIQDGVTTNYSENDPINPSTWDRVDTLSGQITKLMRNVSTLDIVDDGNNVQKINFSGVGATSSVGKFAVKLMRLVNRIAAYYYFEATKSSEDETYYKPQYIQVVDPSDSTGKTKIKISVEPLANIAPTYADENNDEEYRNDLIDLFDYMIHGTLEDVSKVRANPMTITGTFAPQGIFFDPDSGTAIDVISSSISNVLVYNITANPALFATNRTTSLAMDFQVISSQQEGEEEVEEEEAEEENYEPLEEEQQNLDSQMNKVINREEAERIIGKNIEDVVVQDFVQYNIDPAHYLIGYGDRFIIIGNDGIIPLPTLIGEDIDSEFVEDNTVEPPTAFTSFINKIGGTYNSLLNTVTIFGYPFTYKLRLEDEVPVLVMVENTDNLSWSPKDDVEKAAAIARGQLIRDNISNIESLNDADKDQILKDIQTKEFAYYYINNYEDFRSKVKDLYEALSDNIELEEDLENYIAELNELQSCATPS